MRLICFSLLTFSFSSCIQKKPSISIFKTNSFILIDTTAEETSFLNFDNPSGDYAIYFIGPKSDTIKIGKRYWPRRTKWEDNFNIPWIKEYSGKNLKILVNTSVKTNSPDEYLSGNKKIVRDSTENFNSFLLTIQNISDSVIYLGPTFSLFFINREAKNKAGKWVKIDKKLSEISLCLTGEPIITLNPQELVISKVRRYSGSYVTDFRLVFGYANNIVYSNIFKDSIDERILQNAQEANNNTN